MIDYRVIINRVSDDGYSTLGELFVVSNDGYVSYQCLTLELPYKDNAQDISSIPKGDYKVVKRWSEKYKDHFHILNVPNRSHILIHQANYVRELRGCIAVGKDFRDIDFDGSLDTINSRRTLEELLNILPNKFNLTIM